MKKPILAFSIACLILGGSTWAGESVVEEGAQSKTKQVAPKQAIRNGLGNLKKAGGYAVHFEQKIGFCIGGSDQLSQARTVTYQGRVLGVVSELKVNRAPTPFYVRSPKLGAGVDPVSQRWVRYTAMAQGREIAQLYRSPAYHLAQAARYSSRAKWVDDNTLRIPVSSTVSRNTLTQIQNSGCANGG